ncbi:hypothetical protein ACLKA7_006672 [Drosophila subpalustris]
MSVISLNRLIISILALILAVKSQQTPVYYYQTWLYAMPWRPLAIAAPHQQQQQQQQQLDTRQLSLGYTGPQIFPDAPATSTPSRQRPILLGLLTPRQVQGEFTLPFRPSPFAGYSLDEQQEQQQQQQQQQEQHQQQHLQPQQHQAYLEPGFYAPGYPQQTPSTNPVEEPSDEQQIGEDQQQQHFIYMSPATLYNLVRN